MESDRDAEAPAPVPAKYPPGCRHVWTQLTPREGAVSDVRVDRAHGAREGVAVHIGIDPGLAGAVAILDPYGALVALQDTPTLTLASKVEGRSKNTTCLAWWPS